MKIIKTYSLLLVLHFSALLTASANAKDYVVPIDWEAFNSDGPLKLNLQLASDLLLNAARYNAGWIDETFRQDSSGREYVIEDMNEHGIRPAASAAYGLAVVLRTEIFDPEKVGASRKELTTRVAKLIRGLGASHRVNGDSEGWGDHWQSALWAGLAGNAAWMLWDDLDDDSRALLSNVVEYEANRFIAPGYEAPYWNGEGGDSKAEENAWNAMILQVACAMMSDHPNTRDWMEACSELLISAFSTERDMDENRSIDGRPVKDWLKGYNVREDGVVINHNIVHPDYMACIMQNLRSYITQSLAGEPVPEAAAFSCERVYTALMKRTFSTPEYREPGGTIYTSGEVDLYYPNGNDWSYFRFDIYYAIDAFAHVLEFNPDNSQNIEEWMRLRGTRVLNMQLRHEDRRIYAAGEFDRYPGREQLAIWQIADAFMMQWLEANEALHGEADWLATTLPD